MRRTSDWFLFPKSIPYPLGHAGGIWDYRGARYVHRTLLVELPSELRAQVGPPMRSEDLPDVDPTNLRPYQLTGATFVRERDGAILAWEMGVGKSRTALYATHNPSPFGVIVAPKVTWGVWEKEVRLVYGPDVPIHHVRGRAVSNEPRELWAEGIYLLNPEIVWDRRMEWAGTHLDFLIADEAHLYTRGRTARAKGVSDLGLMSKQRVALTGTPILRHTMDLWGILKVVAPTAFGSWSDMAIWLGFRRTAHGWDLQPVSAEARLRLEARLAEVVDWKRWAEVSDSVPPLQREKLPVDLDPVERADYDRLASDVREVLGEEVSWEDLGGAAALMQVNALRRWVGRAKIPFVVDLVRAAGEPVVVWTWHRDVVHMLAAELRDAGLRVVTVTGDEPDARRQEAIRKFQAGDADVFIATIAAGGVGIDLTRARISIMAELSWLPGEVAQAESRVFRSGQTRACITYWPIVADSIEQRMIDVLIAKAEHARSDIFPNGMVKTQAEIADAEMISLLDNAMLEDD